MLGQIQLLLPILPLKNLHSTKSRAGKYSVGPVNFEHLPARLAGKYLGSLLISGTVNIRVIYMGQTPVGMPLHVVGGIF